jgi:hypothetical protein
MAIHKHMQITTFFFFFFWGGVGGEIGKVKLSFQEKIRTWDDYNTS